MKTSTRAAIGGGLVATVAGAGMILQSFLPGFEGETNVAVIPVAGDVPTLCFGYTSGVRMGDTATHEECIHYLRKEIDIALAIVDRVVKVDISEEERAAYGSLTYNVGGGEFSQSSIVRKANKGDRRGACEAIARKEFDKKGVCHGYGCGWSGGRMYRGLQRRRDAERALCLQGVK